MLGPLLGRVAIHSWSQGGTAWSLLVAREKPTARMRRLDQVGEGSGGRSDTWRHWAWRVCRKHRAGRFGGCSKTPPELGFDSFSKTAPVKIPEGRVATSEGLHRVEANYSKSSQPSDGLQCIFPVLPLRAFSLISALRGIVVFRGRLGRQEREANWEWVALPLQDKKASAPPSLSRFSGWRSTEGHRQPGALSSSLSLSSSLPPVR